VARDVLDDGPDLVRARVDRLCDLVALHHDNGNNPATVRVISLRALPGDPFDALGDPNRRAIVELLQDGDRSVRELADLLPISRPAVSRHLKLLKDAGLVIDRAEGTRRLYRLHDEGIDAVRAYLEQVWGEAGGRFRMLADN
jgi:DNA-binding transcriptional ArsR family regulator